MTDVVIEILTHEKSVMMVTVLMVIDVMDSVKKNQWCKNNHLKITGEPPINQNNETVLNPHFHRIRSNLHLNRRGQCEYQSKMLVKRDDLRQLNPVVMVCQNVLM